MTAHGREPGAGVANGWIGTAALPSPPRRRLVIGLRAALVALVAIIATLTVSTFRAAASAYPDRLYSGEELDVTYDHALRSPAAWRYVAVMQRDGNFVVYRYNRFGDQWSGRTPCWASHTAGTGARTVRMQSDGNVVVYAYASIHAYTAYPVWATDTVARPYHAMLVMQDDGNLVLYHRRAWGGWSPVWASHTVGC